jgi:hypothetical protein
MKEEEMGLLTMVKRESLLYEAEAKSTREDLPLADDTPMVIKVHHLEQGCHVPIKRGGMVDVAIRELGAKIVKVEIIEPEEAADTCEE